jgi:hypothetical protein
VLAACKSRQGVLARSFTKDLVTFEIVYDKLKKHFCCKITVSRIVLVLCIGARQLVQYSYITNSSSCYIIYIAKAQNVGSMITNQR